MMKKIWLCASVLTISALLLTPSLEAQARSRSSSSHRVSYGGGRHTTSHGGHYSGGRGSSHKGGHYRNTRTSNRYGRHK